MNDLIKEGSGPGVVLSESQEGGGEGVVERLRFFFRKNLKLKRQMVYYEAYLDYKLSK